MLAPAPVQPHVATTTAFSGRGQRYHIIFTPQAGVEARAGAATMGKQQQGEAGAEEGRGGGGEQEAGRQRERQHGAGGGSGCGSNSNLEIGLGRDPQQTLPPTLC